MRRYTISLFLTLAIIELVYLYARRTAENENGVNLLAEPLSVDNGVNLLESEPVTELPYSHTTTGIKEVVAACSPHKHFAYVKTHKTGSSTVRLVLKLYANKYKLPTAAQLPVPFVGGYPGHIQSRFIFKGNRFENFKYTKESFILYEHYRFNATLLKEIMPADTVYISIMREPWHQFQSSFNYYYKSQKRKKLSYSNCFLYPYYHIARGQKISLSNYLDLAVDNLDTSVPWYFRSKNYQAFDLGLDPNLDDEDDINDAVTRLASEIDLMMITDYMEESLILMKERMCMSWIDILYLSVGKNSAYVPDDGPSEDLMRKYRKLNKIDIALYQHFNTTLWRKVDEYGRERMNNDVVNLQMLQIKYGKNMKKRNPQIKSRNKRSMYDISSSRNLEIPDKHTMIKILMHKLSRQAPPMNIKQLQDMATYMVENNGGCPI